MTQPVRNLHPPEDAVLLADIARGDLDALGSLFDRYANDLKRYFGRLGISASDADDLLQATFLEVVHAAARFNPELRAKNWLLGLATMLVRRHRRSLSRAAKNLLAWSNALATGRNHSLPSYEIDDELRHFQRAYLRLAEKKREVFALVVLEGLSGEEVADILSVPVNTVWTRLFHARRELQAALEGEKP